MSKQTPLYTNCHNWVIIQVLPQLARLTNYLKNLMKIQAAIHLPLGKANNDKMQRR